MKLVFGLLFFLASSSVFSQTEVTWKDLKIDSFVEVFSEEFQANYNIPVFSDSLLELNGKIISIKGYVLTVESNSGYHFIIDSYTASSGGPCGVPGSQMPIEMTLKGYKGVITKKVTIIGKLVLNYDDLIRLSLILEDVKIIE